MAFPSTGPNLTNQKLRRTGGDCQLRQYQIDPHWGIPNGQPPLCFDATTGLVRPFSSYETVATAAAAFVGFATDIFIPAEAHSVWVATAGWVEFKLLASAEITAGDYYKPTLINAATDYVSDDTVEVANMPTDAAIAIFRAVQGCLCNPLGERVACPSTVPVADDTSPTTPSDYYTYQTQRTATFAFGVL